MPDYRCIEMKTGQHGEFKIFREDIALITVMHPHTATWDNVISEEPSVLVFLPAEESLKPLFDLSQE